MHHNIRIHDILHLRSIPKISDRKLINLINHFGSTQELLSQDPRSLVKVAGIRESDASLIKHTRIDSKQIENQFSLINRMNGSILSLWDKDYPEHLKNIYDPPPLLFVRGTLHPADNFSIAIVGTRHPTHYGKLNAELFAKELATRGITVVSGLARGVDTIVHKAAVQHGGRTVAVLGGSIDRIYPRENEPLVRLIESDEHGAVISELPMSTPSHPAFFPRRNRIISGMSLGTLIIESDENGGAMITATTAIDQNRELFCIPGNIAERKSFGTNKLIKNGQAKLVQSIDDIIDELAVSLRPILKQKPVNPDSPQLNAFEQKIYDQLSSEPAHIDIISESAKLSPSDALVSLLGLEFKGIVRQMAGKMFHRL
ncbi:MAG: DNA-processing protein DprA [Bacteroidota bacterium]